MFKQFFDKSFLFGTNYICNEDQLGVCLFVTSLKSLRLRKLLPLVIPSVPFGRGGDTSMAGMAICITGVLNISETGDTMGKIRLHGGKKR